MDKNIFITKAIFVEKYVIQNNKKREKGFSKKIQIFFLKKKVFFFSKKNR